MIILRALVRLLVFVLLIVVALAGLAVVVMAVDPKGGPKVFGLPDLGDSVGHFLDKLEAGGSTEVVSALGGLAAFLLGLAMLVGLLVPRRERLVTLRTTDHGMLSARRRPLSQIAGALAEQAPGVTAAKVKVRPNRTSGGRLRVRADRTSRAKSGDVESAVKSRLEGLTGPFKLRSSVQVRAGGSGSRVQ